MIRYDKRLKIRARKIADIYKNHIKSKEKVLDIGCGNGRMAKEIKSILNLDIELTGTDVLNYNPGFKFKIIENNRIPFKNKEFDSAMLNDVLHHIPMNRQIDIIKEAIRVSDKVLIFEVADTFSGKIVDIITNKLNDLRVKLPLSMRRLDGWIKLFKENNINFEYKIIGRSADQLFLLKNYFFMLKNEN